MIISLGGIIEFFVICHVMVKMILQHVPRIDIVLKIPITDIFVDMVLHRTAAVAAGIVKNMAAAASFVRANASAVRGVDDMSFELEVSL